MTRVMTKVRSLDALRTLIYRAGGRLHIQAMLAAFPDRDRATVYRWLDELGAESDGRGTFTLMPTPGEVEFAQAVLDIAARG